MEEKEVEGICYVDGDCWRGCRALRRRRERYGERGLWSIIRNYSGYCVIFVALKRKAF